MFEDNNLLYNVNEKDFFMTRVSHLDIPFSRKWKKIGVNVSGGADSALLCFLLGKIITDNKLDCKIDIITYQRCWDTRPWQGWWSLQVFNKLKDMFPDIIQNRHTTFIPPQLEHGVSGELVDGRSGDQIIVGEFNKFAAWQNNLDAIFNGTSKNPDDLREDRMKNRDGEANNARPRDVLYYFSKLRFHLCHPLRFVKKDWIVAQYNLYNITDLYYTTRSCEGDINHNRPVSDVVPSFAHYVPGMDVPTCNECWWCEERRWADEKVPDMIREINGKL